MFNFDIKKMAEQRAPLAFTYEHNARLSTGRLNTHCTPLKQPNPSDGPTVLFLGRVNTRYRFIRAVKEPFIRKNNFHSQQNDYVRFNKAIIMDDIIAMQIIGAVLFLLATVKMVNPVKFNESIFGEIPEAEVAKLASMRMVLGGTVMAISLINLICSFMVSSGEATEAILISTSVGLLVFCGSIIASKLRGFIDHIPVPPMVVLPVLAIIGFVGAYV